MDIHAGIQRLGYQFAPFLLAVVIHEVGHGLMASFWGDNTAKDSGRLTLNPIPHIDPMGTLLFPILSMFIGFPIMFGWANPVPIDPRRFRKYRPGLFWVSLAGAMGNFVGAFLCALTLCLMIRFAPPEMTFRDEIITMLNVGVQINFGLGFFNLIPIPPLDGSKVVESFLSYSAQRKYEELSRFSMIILLVLMYSGAFRILMVPISFCYNVTMLLAGFLVGVQV